MDFTIFGNAKISVWNNGHDNGAPRNILLADWIRSTVQGHPKYAPVLQRIHDTIDEAERKHLKSNELAACTPSATWKDRKSETTVPDTLNGWVQFDIDGINDAGKAAELREQLKRIPEIGFCGLSASSRNLWGLVKVKHPEKAVQHFEQLRADFARYGITIDSVGKPKQLRFYTFDPQAYIAKRVTEYVGLPKPKQAPKPKPKPYGGAYRDQYEEVRQAVKVIEQTGTDIARDHDEYLKLGMGIANQFGESGREILHAILRQWHRYSENPSMHYAQNDHNYSNYLRYPDKQCDITAFWKLFYQAGLRLPSHTSQQSNRLIHSDASQGKYGVNTAMLQRQSAPEPSAAEVINQEPQTRPPTNDNETKAPSEQPSPDDSDALDELLAFFGSCTYPSDPIKFDNLTIIDYSKFVQSQVSCVKAIKREVYARPYLKRLKRLKAYIEANGAAM